MTPTMKTSINVNLALLEQNNLVVIEAQEPSEIVDEGWLVYQKGEKIAVLEQSEVQKWKGIVLQTGKTGFFHPKHVKALERGRKNQLSEEQLSCLMKLSVSDDQNLTSLKSSIESIETPSATPDESSLERSGSMEEVAGVEGVDLNINMMNFTRAYSMPPKLPSAIYQAKKETLGKLKSFEKTQNQHNLPANLSERKQNCMKRAEFAKSKREQFLNRKASLTGSRSVSLPTPKKLDKLDEQTEEVEKLSDSNNKSSFSGQTRIKRARSFVSTKPSLTLIQEVEHEETEPLSDEPKKFRPRSYSEDKSLSRKPEGVDTPDIPPTKLHVRSSHYSKNPEPKLLPPTIEISESPRNSTDERMLVDSNFDDILDICEENIHDLPEFEKGQKKFRERSKSEGFLNNFMIRTKKTPAAATKKSPSNEKSKKNLFEKFSLKIFQRTPKN